MDNAYYFSTLPLVFRLARSRCYLTGVILHHWAAVSSNEAFGDVLRRLECIVRWCVAELPHNVSPVIIVNIMVPNAIDHLFRSASASFSCGSMSVLCVDFVPLLEIDSFGMYTVFQSVTYADGASVSQTIETVFWNASWAILRIVWRNFDFSKWPYLNGIPFVVLLSQQTLCCRDTYYLAVKVDVLSGCERRWHFVNPSMMIVAVSSL